MLQRTVQKKTRKALQYNTLTAQYDGKQDKGTSRLPVRRWSSVAARLRNKENFRRNEELK